MGELAKLLYMERLEVLALGDDNNDIEMFQTAGVSAAVGNVSENARLYVEHAAIMRQDVPSRLRLIGSRLKATSVSDVINTDSDHRIPFLGGLARFYDRFEGDRLPGGPDL